jgi:hypothetical protein
MVMAPRHRKSRANIFARSVLALDHEERADGRAALGIRREECYFEWAVVAHEPEHQIGLSIGALSRATNIPVETLRTWERRYGYPVPEERQASLHRRYPVETVDRLLLIQRTLGQGHRPSAVVGASEEQLRSLLRQAGAVVEYPRADFEPSDCLKRWLALAGALDGENLTLDFEQVAGQVGVRRFAEEYAAPFLDRLGEAWACGELRVLHEHFASERLSHFLCDAWQRLSPPHAERRVICAALPGEHHVLGLHMAALMLASARYSVIFLGADCPVEEIAAAVHQSGAALVAVSISRYAAAESAVPSASALRLALPSDVPLVIGGSGAGPLAAVPGLVHLSSLSALYDFCAAPETRGA